MECSNDDKNLKSNKDVSLGGRIHGNDKKDTNISTQQPLWLQGYIDSPEKQNQLYKKTLKILIFHKYLGEQDLELG